MADCGICGSLHGTPGDMRRYPCPRCERNRPREVAEAFDDRKILGDHPDVFRERERRELQLYRQQLLERRQEELAREREFRLNSRQSEVQESVWTMEDPIEERDERIRCLERQIELYKRRLRDKGIEVEEEE